MDKIFEGEGDIRGLFKQMLGSDIIIKDNISENEEYEKCAEIKTILSNLGK